MYAISKEKNDASIHWFSVQFSCIVAISTSLFMDMENHTVTGQDRSDKLKTVPLFNVLIHIKMKKKKFGRWIDDVLTHKMLC